MSLRLPQAIDTSQLNEAGKRVAQVRQQLASISLKGPESVPQMGGDFQ
jgi:hypothetical protein